MNVTEGSLDSAPTEQSKLTKTLRRIWKQRWLFALVLPAILFVVIFNFVPIYGISLSFRNYQPALGPFRSPWGPTDILQLLVSSG